MLIASVSQLKHDVLSFLDNNKFRLCPRSRRDHGHILRCHVNYKIIAWKYSTYKLCALYWSFSNMDEYTAAYNAMIGVHTGFVGEVAGQR